MALTSLKLSKKEQKEEIAQEPTSAPEYPYGLRLHLDEDELEKLGIDDLPEVGETMMIVAKVTVTDTHESKNERKVNKSVSLQITDMAFQAEKKKDDAEVLYGGE